MKSAATQTGEYSGRRLYHTHWRVYLLILGLAVSAGLFGCENARTTESTAEAAPIAFTPEQTRLERQGQSSYENYCVHCHGAKGEGNGFNAYNLDPRPRNLADPAFMQTVSDADLMSVIKGGGRSIGGSVLMPPWGKTLTDRQIQSVIAYLRTLTVPEPQKTAEGEESR